MVRYLLSCPRADIMSVIKDSNSNWLSSYGHITASNSWIGGTNKAEVFFTVGGTNNSVYTIETTTDWVMCLIWMVQRLEFDSIFLDSMYTVHRVWVAVWWDNHIVLGIKNTFDELCYLPKKGIQKSIVMWFFSRTNWRALFEKNTCYHLKLIQ